MSDPTAPASNPTPDALNEDAAWAELERHWAEPAAHRAYLDRFQDLDGLSAAGRRYRSVLEVRPGDPQALAMKSEVLKRATVVGLALMPRAGSPGVPRGIWTRRLTLLGASWLAGVLAWAIFKLLGGTTP
jgi:hypothetical protein